MKYIFLLYTFLFGMCESHAQVMFQKIIGNDQWDFPRSVKMYNDGGYFIGGISDETQAGSRIFMTKLNSIGDTVWTRMYTESNGITGEASGFTNDGGYFIAGNISANLVDYQLTKTDSNGVVLWSNFYGTTTEDNLWSAIETSDNGFILVGRTDVSSTNNSLLIVKIDPSGTLQWTKKLDVPNSGLANKVLQTIDGGYIITGNSVTSPDINVYLIKLSNIGNLEWFNSYDLSYDYGRSICLTSDGGFMIAGSTMGSNFNVLLIKTDSLGQVMWSKTYDTGTTEDRTNVIQTSDGGYGVIGTTNTTVFLIRTDSFGNPLWAKNYTAGSDFGFNFPTLLQSGDNGFLIASLSAVFTISNFPDMYIIKTDSMGNSGCYQNVFNPVVQVVAPGVNVVTPLVSSPVLITGPLTIVRIAGAEEQTLCLNTSLQDDLSSRNYLEVFPNPANNTIFFKGVNEQVKEISLFNNLGSRVLHVIPVTNNMDTTIDIRILKQGIYFVSLITESGVRCAKFVKE